MSPSQDQNEPNRPSERAVPATSHFYGASSIFIPGAERVPLSLLGTLRDGMPRSEIRRGVIDTLGGNKLVYTEVALRLQAEDIHEKGGHKILSDLARTNYTPRTKQFVRGLASIRGTSGIETELNQNESGENTSLTLLQRIHGEVFDWHPQVMIAALAELYDLADQYFQAKLRRDASELFGLKNKEDPSLEVRTQHGSYYIPLAGTIPHTRTPYSKLLPQEVQVNIPAAVIHPANGDRILRQLDMEPEHLATLHALFEGLPLSSQEQIQVRVGGHRTANNYKNAFLRISFHHSASLGEFDVDSERRAFAMNAVATSLQYIEDNVPGMSWVDRQVQKILKQQQAPATLSDLFDTTLLKDKLYVPPKWRDFENPRPFTPVEESGFHGCIRMFPVNHHPVLKGGDSRDYFVRTLNDSPAAVSGGLVITFVNFETPTDLLAEGYWRIDVEWNDEESRQHNFLMLQQFLEDYYLTLRSGLPVDELNIRRVDD
ncbi:MAG: hypothetical protein J5J00_15415 [Deltaproteobacteria bacterium]|nr:hypothetical protein [Deltaproteobacteria bacterium]